jgi:hypothetical protein
MELTMIKALLVATFAVVIYMVVGCSVLKTAHYNPDNVMEELVEEEIAKYSGIDVDLSPSSPESR